MKSREPQIFVLAIACCALTATAVAQEPALTAQAPVIQVHVQQVLVPVVVTDRKGHAVTDLRASDFRVFEDGVEQKLADVRASSSGPTNLLFSQSVPGQVTGPSVVPLPAAGGPLLRQTYFVVLDSLFSSFGDFAQVRNALQQLFEEESGADAQYALLALGRKTVVLQNITRDPSVILSALKSKEATQAILSSEASSLAQQEMELIQMLSDPSQNDDPDEIARWINAAADERSILTKSFLHDLRDLTEQLSGMPGRRVMVLVSDGFNLRPGRELFAIFSADTNPSMLQRSQGSAAGSPVKLKIPDAKNPAAVLHDQDDLSNEARAIVQLATARNVTFYTLDSRGLFSFGTGGLDLSQPGGSVKDARAVPNLLGVEETVAVENQGALNYFAQATGGVFFHDSNALLKGLRQAFADGRQYYVLAYTSSNPAADGRYRAIKVQLVKGKGLTIRAKPGYWAPGRDSATLAAATAAEPNPLAPPPSGGNIPTSPAPRHAKPAAVPMSEPSLVDTPIAELAAKMAELKNLDPAASQDLLTPILQKVGANIAVLFDSFPNITSHERVIEQRQIVYESVQDQIVRDFDYLALANPDRGSGALKEYRTDDKGRLVNANSPGGGYVITQGFVSEPLTFHPSYQAESRFRLLGQQQIDKRAAYVVAFAQKPSARTRGWITIHDNARVPVLTQGLAWIDPTTDQIIRIWTEMETPEPQIKLRSLTTRITFAEVHFQGMAAGIWLPRQVEVETKFSYGMFKNIHSYSQFKQFAVETQQRPSAPTP